MSRWLLAGTTLIWVRIKRISHLPGLFDLAASRDGYPPFMGIWFQSVALADGEEVRYRAAANSFRGRRSIGGQVTVTDRRLIFLPNRLDAVTGGRRRAMTINDIRTVRMLEAGRRAASQRGLGAALRRQVEVDDGSEVALVVTVRDPERLTRLLHR